MATETTEATAIATMTEAFAKAAFAKAAVAKARAAVARAVQLERNCLAS